MGDGQAGGADCGGVLGVDRLFEGLRKRRPFRRGIVGGVNRCDAYVVTCQFWEAFPRGGASGCGDWGRVSAFDEIVEKRDGVAAVQRRGGTVSHPFEHASLCDALTCEFPGGEGGCGDGVVGHAVEDHGADILGVELGVL